MKTQSLFYYLSQVPTIMNHQCPSQKHQVSTVVKIDKLGEKQNQIKGLKFTQIFGSLYSHSVCFIDLTSIGLTDTTSPRKTPATKSSEGEILYRPSVSHCFPYFFHANTDWTTWGYVAGAPVEFLHSITSSWSVGATTYYRHKVIIKNTSLKPITDLKLVIENLSGSIWGLSPTKEKNIYELPQWLKVLNPGSECTFVYVQGGPQAKISIHSFYWSFW